MVGKCIRKSDGKVINYQFLYEKSFEEFFVFDVSWKLIGSQDDFEKQYTFKDELTVAFVLNFLNWAPIPDELFSRLLDNINSVRNFKDQSLEKKLKRYFPSKKISALCINDVTGIDVNGNTVGWKKLFFQKNSYNGILIRDSHYFLIGEKITWDRIEPCCVNQKIVDSFSSGGNHFENFRKHFFLMNPDETKEDAWKRYQVKIASERFDM